MYSIIVIIIIIATHCVAGRGRYTLMVKSSCWQSKEEEEKYKKQAVCAYLTPCKIVSHFVL